MSKYGVPKPDFRCVGPTSQQPATVDGGQQRLLAVALSALARGLPEPIWVLMPSAAGTEPGESDDDYPLADVL